MRHAVPAEAERYWTTMGICDPDTANHSCVNHVVDEGDSAQSRLYLCTSCLLSDREEGWMWPAEYFGAESRSQVWQEIIQQGAWGRCLLC